MPAADSGLVQEHECKGVSTVRSFFRSAVFALGLIGTLVVGIGGAEAKGPGDCCASENSVSLTSARDHGGYYQTEDRRLAGVSLLCRLPVEIGMWKALWPN
jgi:hypothetical protein